MFNEVCLLTEVSWGVYLHNLSNRWSAVIYGSYQRISNKPQSWYWLCISNLIFLTHRFKARCFITSTLLLLFFYTHFGLQMDSDIHGQWSDLSSRVHGILLFSINTNCRFVTRESSKAVVQGRVRGLCRHQQLGGVGCAKRGRRLQMGKDWRCSQHLYVRSEC